MSSSNSNNEAFTHPQLYREYMNHPSNNNNNKKEEATPLKNKKATEQGKEGDKKSTASSDEEWDLYPKLVRDIENYGTPEQVEHLHELERTPSHH